MIPAKPFPTYKWRWLSVQPSENLLQAPIFLGVLRSLYRHEGDAFSSLALKRDLKTVEDETESPVTLARDRNRNLFRNSGQYWRGTGLIVPQHGVISLTALGRRVATGKVTTGEFAALMVQQTVLPNPATYTNAEMARWNAADLQIRPLKLILEVLEALGKGPGGLGEAYLTNTELVRIVIPLAGISAQPSVMSRYLRQNRRGALDLTAWPDCAPAANDWRLAREFLLFLSNFGILRSDPTPMRRDDQRFYLPELFDVDGAVDPINVSIFEGDEDAEEAVDEIRESNLPSIVERQRVLTQVLARPNQGGFRSKVLRAAQGRCIITGEVIPQILEAAHIIPVTQNGSDEEDNGLCMRVDIHRLYDSGNLRIKPNGDIVKSDVLAQSNNYATIPANVQIPPFIKIANLDWRDSYL